MALMRVQVAFPWDSGLPEDVSTNTFYFQPANVDFAAAGLAIDNLMEFYDTVSYTYRVRDTFSSLLTGAVVFKIYDMDDPEPRAPVRTSNSALSNVPSSAIPPECAIVVSFQAAPVSGQSQKRRRGRVYLGPLNNSIFASATSPLLLPAFQHAIAGAAARLIDSSATDAQPWSVYSPTNQTAVAVAEGWVNNEIDTQRRRGLVATNRELFSASTWP